MSPTNLSRRVYAATLFLYPAALRHKFAEEMIEVFSEQIRDAAQREGWLGELKVWICIAGEAFRAAMLSHLQPLSITVISGLTALGITCVFLCATSGR